MQVLKSQTSRISSEACARNKKENSVLFGSDTDVFKPERTQLEPYIMLKQMVNEEKDLIDKRSFHRLEALINRQATDNLLFKKTNKHYRNFAVA